MSFVDLSGSIGNVQHIIDPDTTPSGAQDTAANNLHKTYNLPANNYRLVCVTVGWEGRWQVGAGDGATCTCDLLYNAVSQKDDTLRQSAPLLNSHTIQGVLKHSAQQQAAVPITVRIGNGNASIFARVNWVTIEGIY